MNNLHHGKSRSDHTILRKSDFEVLDGLEGLDGLDGLEGLENLEGLDSWREDAQALKAA